MKQEVDDSVQPTGAPQLAHSPTSLLSLPNDILLLIFEEVYEERQLAITKTIPLRIAEILINKRIFSHCQPLWYRHLSISRDQLDLRLSGIFDDKARRSRLRSLDIFINNFNYNLVKSVLLRLPHLTYLTLNISHKLNPTATTVLIGIVSSLARLKHLRLRSPQVRQQIVDFWEAYLDHHPHTTISISFECQGVVYSQEHLQVGTNLTVKSFELYPGASGFLDASSWSTYSSLTLGSYGQLLIWTDEILSGLASAIENKELRLERLKLDVYFRPSNNPGHFRCLEPRDYKQLLQLLQRTKLQQLQLAALESIPDTPIDVEIRSVRLLRLSGPCSFKDSQTFQNLFSLLSALPSLTQLHLVGSSFFDVSSSADEMSKSKAASLSFRYPELGVLLAHLRSSDVLIFTYRGQDENREMRWTRVDTKEEFDRDCWTL